MAPLLQLGHAIEVDEGLRNFMRLLSRAYRLAMHMTKQYVVNDQDKLEYHRLVNQPGKSNGKGPKNLNGVLLKPLRIFLKPN